MVSLLKSVAASNSSVLCTIHQPSSEVFLLFDMVIFMKDGMVLYHGDIDGLLPHFSKFDYHCPVNYNPSDYVMRLCQTVDNEILEKGMLLTDCQHHSKEEKNKQDDFVETDFELVKAPFTKQLYHLCKREARNIRRDRSALFVRFGMTIFLNFLYGLVFLNAGGKDDSDPNNLNAHFGAIVFVLVSSMYGPANAVIYSFPAERPVFIREYATGTCKYLKSTICVVLILNFS